MTCMDKLRELKAKAQAGDMTAAETEKMAEADRLREKFEAAMEDDLIRRMRFPLCLSW